MEIQGKIVQILPEASGVGQASGKAWRKQEYILETLDGQYPRKICFNLWGDAIDRAKLQVGEDVTVQIDIESREFNGRWYTDVKAWRVDRGIITLNAEAPGVAPQSGYPAPPPPAPAAPAAATPQPSSPFGGKQPPRVEPGTAPSAPLPAADDLPF